ncbi:unnamed protein product [Protopolystoma xenopodis]|uniref:Uncharacterized protein n=1 Tax=Protopolystoma xenopodis TaxID=117903 RepID=A0A448XLP7_9PLAT|nr:unnamed protein product [Protopolystoma xenopodis]
MECRKASARLNEACHLGLRVPLPARLCLLSLPPTTLKASHALQTCPIVGFFDNLLDEMLRSGAKEVGKVQL